MSKPKKYITFHEAASCLFDITGVEFVKDFIDQDKISIDINDTILTIAVEEQWYGPNGISPNYTNTIKCTAYLEELSKLSTSAIKDFVLDRLNATTTEVKDEDELSKLDIDTEGFLCKVYFKNSGTIDTMISNLKYSLSDILKFIEDSIGREN